jgi:SOS response regulatory protein OraA/RecX
LKRKLLLLGVGKSLADEALDEILGGVSQEEEAGKAASAFVAKKSHARKEEGKLRQQLTAYLLRRGYTWDAVQQAVRSALKGERREGEDL